VVPGDQLPESKSRAEDLLAESTPALDHIVGDATEAYPRASGLKRFVRHLLFLKPDTLIVIDDIALDSAKQLELRFHPEEKTTREADGEFVFTGKKAALRIDPLTRAEVETDSGEDATVGQLEKAKDPLFSIRLRKTASAWRNAVALTWSAAGAEPVKVHLSEQGECWTFTSGGRAVSLDWATGKSDLRQVGNK